MPEELRIVRYARAIVNIATGLVRQYGPRWTSRLPVLTSARS
jgi:hypothetical protein